MHTLGWTPRSRRAALEVTNARPTAPRSRAARTLHRITHWHISRSAALPVAIALALCAGAADAVTTSDAIFTLFYILPIGIAVWYRSRRAGYVMVVLCSVLSVSDELKWGHLSTASLLWNFFGEVSLYVLFAVLVDLLRLRLATEAALRKEALTQLRHADRLTTIGRLAAGLAHELGTPLNVVSGKASLISSGRLVSGEARSSAIVIEEQVDRMTAIIRHLLDFARRGGTGRQATSLLTLGTETLELMRPLARRSSVTMTCSGPEAMALVNRGELQQVLSNLVTNAIHAMPRGGAIALTTELEPETVVLRVHDEGEGIPTEVLPRIFDPFFTTKEVGQGTGLGLSVVHGIVDDHGGSIEVETEVGRGTTFILRLPRSTSARL